MDYREKWLTTLRELGQFDLETIRKVVFELNGKTFPVARYMFPINHNLFVYFQRGKRPSIEILTRKGDSFEFSFVYCSGYYLKDALDKLPTEIKEKVTSLLEKINNQSSLLEAKQGGERKAKLPIYRKKSQYQSQRPVPTSPVVKFSSDDLNILTELGKYIGGNMSLKKPNDELDVKFIISNFLMEKHSETTLDPDILFYGLIDKRILESYQLAGRTYYRLKQN